MQKKIDKYFKETPEEEWTVTGLALALDTTRDGLIRYSSKLKKNKTLSAKKLKEFSNTIKKAKEKVHNAYEKDLRKRGRSGDIFALKNFGWSDKKEVEHSGEISLGDLFDEATKDEE